MLVRLAMSIISASICSIDDVDVVVTDSDVRDADVDWIKERGVDVIVA